MSTSPVKPHAVLLVTGGGWHDFTSGAAILSKSLTDSGRFTVTQAHLKDNGVPEFASLSSGQFRTVLLYTQGGQLTSEQEEGLVRFVEAGGGLVGIHCASDSFTKNDRFMKLIGSQFKTHPPGVFEFVVKNNATAIAAGHPLVTRTDDFLINDEHYILEPRADFEVFAYSHLQGKDHPMGYTRKQGKGTVVYLANGHHPQSLSQRNFLRLLERSLRLASGEDLSVKNPIRAGILGYGGAFNMGKYHAEAINAQFGMKVVAVCDLDPKRAAQAKVELGESIQTSTNMDSFLADPSFDLVVEILPHNLHAKACIAASKGGKHVITEKPFCITLAEADAMIQAAAESGKALSCFHNRRWDGDFLRILNIVRAGTLGDVFHIDAATSGYGMPGAWWRSSKEISGGILYDWGAHYMDWTLNLMPKRIASVSGFLQKRYWHNSSNEDFAMAVIRYEDGTTSTLEQGNLAAIGRPGWRVLGTRGGLTNGGPHQDITVVTYHDNTRRETKVPGGPGTSNAYYQNIGNHLLLGEELVVKAQEARRAIAVLNLAEVSSNQGGKPVEVPGEAQYTPRYLQPW